MTSEAALRVHRRRVLITWSWCIVGPAVLAALALALTRGNLSVAGAAYSARPYLSSFIELTVAGLVPLAWTVLAREPPGSYGLRRHRLIRSLALSAPVVAVVFAIRALSTGRLLDLAPIAVQLPAAAALAYALFGVLVYGPVEAFFVVWLVRNSDAGWPSPRLLSPGLVVTVGLFGVLHLAVTRSGLNAALVTVAFAGLMLAYKSTGNSWGALVGWTVANTQVWYLAQLAFG